MDFNISKNHCYSDVKLGKSIPGSIASTLQRIVKINAELLHVGRLVAGFNKIAFLSRLIVSGFHKVIKYFYIELFLVRKLHLQEVG